MTIKIKANTNNKSGKQKPPQILKLCQKGPGLKKRKQKTGTNKKYKTKNKEEIKKHNRSPIPIPDPKKGHKVAAPSNAGSNTGGSLANRRTC